jgi:hypothetical protein
MTKDNEFELLKTFHDQFSQTQIAGKTIFIQFLTAVFVVIFGYSYILAQINGAFIEVFNVVKDPKTGEVISYSLIHFIFGYIVTQIVVILLASLILNTGYEFRRDQLVVFETRKKYIGSDYSQIFGDDRFSPLNKNLWTYLPGFHFIFYSVFFFIQIVLGASFFIVMINISETLHLNNFGAYLWMLIVGLFPFVYSNIYYTYYFKKYKKAMNRSPIVSVKTNQTDEKV